MKKIRFTEEQMVAVLREADKALVPEVARKYKVSEQTIYVWRQRLGNRVRPDGQPQSPITCFGESFGPA